MFQNPCLGTET